MTRLRRAALAAAALGTLLTGCVGKLVTVAPQMPEHYADAGPTRGSACGFLLLDLIPIAINDRADRAYAAALHNANAVAVTDTTIADRWYFAVLGTVLCTDLAGQAVRVEQPRSQ